MNAEAENDLKGFKYWAFLSYSHTDRKWGDWLHKALETYRVPSRLVGRDSRDGRVPSRVFPIFRDREELPVSADLGANINQALTESRYLIVICSPRSAQSRWVGEEIKTYKQFGREDRILALIIDGEPNASDGKPGVRIEDECFHEAMRYRLAPDGTLSRQRTEPIAGDAREGRGGKLDAKLKLLAGLLGVNYDDIKQREHERRLRRARVIVASAVVLVGLFAALAVALFFKEREATRARDQGLTTLSQSEFLQSLRSIDEDKSYDALPQLTRSLSVNSRNAAALCRVTTLLVYHNFALPTSSTNESADIYWARFSPDGKQIVTVSKDDTITQVWDARNGKPLAEPMKPTAPAVSAHFIPDEDRMIIASGDVVSNDNTEPIRDAQSDQPLRNDSRNFSAQFSPEGNRIVTLSRDNTVRVWDRRSGQPLTGPMPHDEEVSSAQFSRDGKRIVTASGRTARVWDAETGQPLTGPMKHDGPVSSAQFSPDGRRIATASADKTARVWDAQTSQPLTEPLKHLDWVGLAQFSPDGKRIVTVSGSGMESGGDLARVWDAQTGQPLTEPMKHDDDVVSAQFSPDGKQIVTVSGDLRGWEGTARVWDAQSGKAVTEPKKVDGPVSSAEFSPDGKRIVTASGHTARVWDAQTGRPLTGPMKHDGAVSSVQFSPDGRRIATASADKTARVWDAQTGQPLTEPLKHPDSVGVAHFSPDGKRIVTASQDKTARIWDAWTGQPLTGPMKHDNEVESAQFSSDGKRIVTVSFYETARVWDAQSGLPVKKPSEHEKLFRSTQISPDWKRIVSALEDDTARIFDVQSGKQITEPLKHDSTVTSAQFSPDGKLIVTGSGHEGRGTSAARVWDSQSGKPLSEPLQHDGVVRSAQFSWDGKWIVTAAGDTIQVWDILPRGQAPKWLTSLAEAVADQHLNDQGVFGPLDEDPIHVLEEIRAQLSRVTTDDDWTIFGRWFLADRSTRTISPFSKMTMPEYIENRIKENTPASLNEAEQLALGNPELLKRIKQAGDVLPKDSQ